MRLITGDFYVDPWRPVHSAVVTHAHGDHATPGSENYLATVDGMNILRARLGSDARIQSLPSGACRIGRSDGRNNLTSAHGILESLVRVLSQIDCKRK